MYFLKTDQIWKVVAGNIPVFIAILKAAKLQMSALKDSQSEIGKFINFKRKGSLLTLF